MRKYRLPIALALASLLTACSINQPTLTKVTDKYFVVAYPLRYGMNDKSQLIEVPVGFLTDLASIPRALWWWESPIDRSLAPAIIHDYLYWDQTCTKEEADVVLYLAMEETGVSRAKRELIYAGVSKTSEAQEAWDDNRAAKKNGESRFLSADYVKVLQAAQTRPDATLGSVYADAVKKKGIRRPAPNPLVKQACDAAFKFYTQRETL
jgi:hypothetical protein